MSQERRERKFNPYRCTNRETLQRYISDTQSRLLRAISRKRGHKDGDRQAFDAIVGALLCDLVACSLSGDPALIICLSRARLHGKHTARYYSDLERSEQFRSIVEALGKLEGGPLLFNRALPWMPKPGQRLEASTIEPSPTLCAAIKEAGWSFADLNIVRAEKISEPLILKREKDPENAYWDVAQPIGYEESELTRRLRAGIEGINANLEKLKVVSKKASAACIDQTLKIAA